MEQNEGKYRILIVDDDPENVASSQELLAQRGFQVATCCQSTQVMSLLKAQAFDVVLLDIRMPELEGTDLLPLIKKAHPHLSVIVASAYADPSQTSFFRELGAFEVLGKPFSRELLLDAVERSIHQREQIPLVLTNFSLRQARDQVYRKLILSALRKTNWNQVKAADLLGVSRYCLMRWIRKLGISY